MRGIEANAVDDLPRIQAMAGGVGVKLVEVGHAHGEVGVGEELDRLGLGAVGKHHGDVLLDRALLQQPCEGFGPRRALANDDPRGVKVVVQGLALSQELGREENVFATKVCLELGGVAHRHRGLDDHHRLRVDRQHVPHHGLDGLRIEVVGLGVVVGGGSDDDKVGPLVCIDFIERGAEVQRFVD